MRKGCIAAFTQRATYARLAACACLLLGGWLQNTAQADTLHSLWEIHGAHNTVYLLGSIHVLRPADYPLPKAILNAYGDANSVVMEINLDEMNSPQLQAEMLASAMLPEGKTLHSVLGPKAYSHAEGLARTVGVELSTFDSFAPWFAAEAISQLQLAQMGFEPQSGVEMFFAGHAQTDGKAISGLETAHDQIALFQAMSLEQQAHYLIASLEEAHDLPKQVNSMVQAWQHGDTAWFNTQLAQEIGADPALYQSVLGARNRKWIPKIETLLRDNKNYLVIVGTGHLIGRDSVLDLLKKDGFNATQR